MKTLQDFQFDTPKDFFRKNKVVLCRAVFEAGCISSGGGSGTVTSIAAISPLTGGTITTTGTIGIDQATGSTDGYISSTDWNTFNNKAENTISDGIVSGGTVTWLQNYDYEVSASTYYIGGALYSSPATQITLSPADATLDRIDVFVLTTSSIADSVEGTPSATPEEPDIDPSTQIKISFAVVLANSTEPTVTQQWIYRENAGASAEWNLVTNSAGTISLASTNNPYAGTKDIEGTLVINGNSFTATAGSSPTMSLYDAVVFKIRSKATWGTTRSLSIRFFNGTTGVGNTIIFAQNSYGFLSTNTTSYQNITIPLSAFGAVSAANAIRFIRTGGGAGIGFYIDDIQLINLGLTSPQNTGTVTSVSSGSLGTIFTTAVANPTTTPAISYTLATQTANRVFAGPTSGGTATPTFRALVTADLPAGVGTVTSLGLTSSDITVGGTASPITTSGTYTLTLPTVNSNVGTFGSATQVAQVTTTGKGLITAISNLTITPAASSITGGAALTKVDDTNVTLTLGGTPSAALLAATSLTLGWTGTLAAARLNANVVQAITNDTNITGSISTQNLTLGWAGTLGVARGGTNIASYAIGDLLYASGSTTLSKLADVAAGSYLRSGGVTTAPAWSTITLPNAATSGDIWYASATSVISALAKGSDGQVLTLASGLPSWAAAASGAISSVSNSDGTLTISPTTGAVVASIALGHANTWTANTIFQPTVTTGTGATAGVQVAVNSLTTGDGVSISSSSVTTGNVVNILSTSTAAASNTQTALNIATSGTNSASTQTTYGLQVSNAHAGGSSTNIAGYFSATGSTGTNNYAGWFKASGGVTNNYGLVVESGRVGIGTTTPQTGFHFEVSAATGTYIVLTSTNSRQSSISYNYGTTTKWQSIMDFGNSGTADFVAAYDQAASKARLYFNTTGGISLGGTAHSVATSSINIDVGAYRTTNGGSNLTPKLGILSGASLTTAGALAHYFDNTNGLIFTASNGTLQEARAAINITSLTNTAGSETGDLSFYTQSGGTAISEKMVLSSTGVLRIGASAPASSSANDKLTIAGTSYGFMSMNASASGDIMIGMTQGAGDGSATNRFYGFGIYGVNADVNYGGAFGTSGNFALNTYFSAAFRNVFTVNAGTQNMYFTGKVGFGAFTSPTAFVHIANSAGATIPLQLTSGTVVASPAAGGFEFTTDDLYFTITTGTARKTVVLTDGTVLTSGRVPFASTNGRLIDDSSATYSTSTGLTLTKPITATGVNFAYVAKTGTYTITAADYTIDCQSGTFTVTLPTAAGIAGRIYNITNSGAGTITIATTSSETFKNVATTPTTLTLAAVGNYQVQSTGVGWLVL